MSASDISLRLADPYVGGRERAALVDAYAWETAGWRHPDAPPGDSRIGVLADLINRSILADFRREWDAYAEAMIGEPGGEITGIRNVEGPFTVSPAALMLRTLDAKP